MSARRWLASGVLALLVCGAAALPVEAQTIVERYRALQVEERVGHGMAPMTARRPTELPVFVRLPGRRAAVAETDADRPIIDRWKRVPKLARNWFSTLFPDVDWVYRGANTAQPLDTTRTIDLRARLEAHFGAPTQTLADFGPLHRLRLDDYVQFEYWFVLNDTIPLIVMDVNGPYERGLVTATDAAHASALNRLTESFLTRLVESDRRAPYVDYYFEPETRTWHRCGYDGRRFFIDRIWSVWSVIPGRPVLPRRNEPGP